MGSCFQTTYGGGGPGGAVRFLLGGIATVMHSFAFPGAVRGVQHGVIAPGENNTSLLYPR
jgi:hypothetical protein